MNAAKPSLAFTVDVEDWPQSSWNRSLPISDYCADNALRVLELINQGGAARGTFFILGKFAERHPQVVRAIHDAGHEIASHGYGHVEIFHLDKQQFGEDLRRSIDAIGSAVDVRPLGYRAPDFSIVGESLWALDVLAELGFAYDSSIFPLNKARYGIGDWPRRPVRVALAGGGSIVEFPLATMDLFGRRLPAGGGGYARLLPARAMMRTLRLAGRQLEGPPVFYCHPYELDAEEFSKMGLQIPWKVRMHQGLGRRGTAGKLSRLFETFECVSLSDVLAKRGDEYERMEYPRFILDPATVQRPPTFEGATVVPDVPAA